MRPLILAVVVVALAVAFHLAPVAGVADQKDMAPDLAGLDYRTVIREQLDHVGAGNTGKAMEAIEKHAAPGAFTDEKKVEFRKSFALLFANAGKYGGAELVGFKRLGSRYLRVYSLAHFEKGSVTFLHLFAKTADGWKLSTLSVIDGITELDAATPLVAFPPVKD